jgi:hypothetical protein
MPDKVIVLLIPFIGVVIIVAWVPLLNLICPPCGRALERRRVQMNALQTRSSLESIRD